MPRRSPKSGNYIISAGEVGTFTVCPESWRLKHIAGVEGESSGRETRGAALHESWVAEQDEYLYLIHRVKFVLVLLAIAVVMYAVK